MKNYYINTSGEFLKLVIATYIGLLLLIAFIFPIISGFLFWIYLKATEIDISEAIKGNAITDY